jgi:hypothetical protein
MALLRLSCALGHLASSKQSLPSLQIVVSSAALHSSLQHGPGKDREHKVKNIRYQSPDK